MTVDLNFLHFLVTVIVLLFLIIPRVAQHYKKVNKYDEAFSKPWGLIGFVSKDGEYITRVPSQKGDN